MAQPRSNAGTSPAPDTRRAHSLDKWCGYGWENGVQVPDLAPLDRLLVRTLNSVYEVIVVEPARAEVVVRGGQFFPQFTRAVVGGSSVGRGFLKLHGIYKDFCLELHSDELSIVTSPVRDITRPADGGQM